AAPDAVLAAVECDGQAVPGDRAAPADGLGPGGLRQGRTGRADGEPVLWIVVPACRLSSPIAHRPTSLSSSRRGGRRPEAAPPAGLPGASGHAAPSRAGRGGAGLGASA